jgi:hypothetical protein
MYPKSIDPIEMCEVADDFVYPIAYTPWTSLDDGGTGTNTINAVAGGTISIITAAAANDYHLLFSSKLFLPAAKKPIWFATRYKAGTAAGMQYFGLSSDVTATLITDGTGVVVNTGSMALFYCLPAVLGLGFMTSNSTVQTKQAGVITQVAAQWYQAGFHIDSGDGTNAIVSAWVVDETAGTRTNAAPQSLALASLAQMGVIFGVKSAGAAETLIFDYVRCCQKR